MRDHDRTGRRLQRATIAWNLAEVFVTVGLGVAARSLALVAFGLDSLVEVFASAVVLWHMSRMSDPEHDRRAHKMVAFAFAVLATSLLVASSRALWIGTEPDSSPAGMIYLAVTALVMFVLAAWKLRIGKSIGNELFLDEARMTLLDGWLATSIFVALGLNTLWGWWWADPAAAAVVGLVAAREAVEQFTRPRPTQTPRGV